MNLIELIQNNNAEFALIAGILVAITCAILGVFVTVRRESLFSDGLAHASLAGVAIAITFAVQPFYIALITAILMAIGMTYIKRNTNIYSDAIIGILFTLLFSTGLIILSLTGQHELELETYLFGTIEDIQPSDLIFAFLATAVTVGATAALYKKLIFITIDPEGAFIRGIKVALIEYLLAILLSISIIISIKLVGVLLATALLIIPATNAKLLAKRFGHMFPISIVHNIIATVIGILLARQTPPGATIVLVSGALLMLGFFFRKIKI